MTFDLNKFWSAETREHLGVAEKTFATLAPDFTKMLDACAARQWR
jgi:hypothetical protein